MVFWVALGLKIRAKIHFRDENNDVNNSNYDIIILKIIKTSLIGDISKNEKLVHEPIQRIRHKDGRCMEVQDVIRHVSKDHNQNQISLDKLDTHI